MAHNPRGNPVKRRRGEAVRAVMMAVLKPDTPLPLDEVMTICKLSRVEVLQQLARLQEGQRIRGYTTANMMVRVW